ncbi:hypothetical protein IWW48_001519 [Coemansia sp. RSA 1200]|nr:hypothetical protein IWW48_001519 [Coemansia sp. RSA 1200]
MPDSLSSPSTLNMTTTAASESKSTTGGGSKRRKGAASGANGNTNSANDGTGQKDSVKNGGVRKQKATTASNSRSPTANEASSHRRMDSVGSSNGDSSIDDEDNDTFDEGGKDSNGVLKSGKSGNDRERRRKFLERNRIAASKCRQKKKMWVQELERRAEDATMQNRSLHIAVAQLKEEVLILKNQLLTHHNCGCTTVQQYLQNECGAPATGPSVAHAVSAAVAASGFPLSAHAQQPMQLHPQQQQVQPSPSSAMAAAVAAAASVNQGVNMNVSAAAPPLLLQPPPPQQQIQRAQGFHGPNSYHQGQNPHPVGLSGAMTAVSSSTGVGLAYSGVGVDGISTSQAS